MTAPPQEDEVTGDTELVASSLREPERFALVYDRYFDDIHRYLAARLGSEAADDLAADTFLVAFRRRADFDPSRGTAVRPWLYGIATNLVAQHRRAEQRRLRAMGRVGAEVSVAGHEERVTARVAAETLRPDLVRAVRGLSSGERDVVFLSAPAGLGYEEIAHPTGRRAVSCSSPPPGPRALRRRAATSGSPSSRAGGPSSGRRTTRTRS
ncbi:RNA polymerase sigma factor [Actinomadura logoneensis]|uniref:RNA polymerase sigma factor n=1 Tax=Actinomadura logoneensis TaxID=2293572 RepID=A0A372JFN6_9ACTN|nr:RNA polymerase sigma factor [Actinomadura logoneensis]RFU38616.1 RNA polymerase sigma factor [Actinomadura logoneensis]